MDTEGNGNEILTGFELLRDATKDTLIDEILTHQKQILGEMELPQLRINVIEIRVGRYKRRLAEEAGVVQTIFGYAEKPDDDDE